MSCSHYPQSLLPVGFTAVFIAYLTVWLPGPAAGLSFIGVEMGEWIKFMGMGPTRNWFYLPPISLGLMLVLWTVGWPNGRWQTWLMRGMAVLISWLSFPAIEDITGSVAHEYWPRVWAIILVVVVAGVSGLSGQRPRVVRLKWLLMMGLGVAGIVLPTWVYGQARTAVSDVLGLPIGYGWGVWLNGVGHLLIIAVAVWQMRLR